jgi:hypothetical protein
MPDWKDELEMDEHGQLRKKRVVRDREKISFTMQMMDAANGRFVDHFADGTPDHTNPHRPGHRFLDTNDPAKLAAQEAYDARSRRMETAWRRKGEQHQQGNEENNKPTLDEARAASDAAYQARSERMRKGWKHKDATP